MKTREQALAEFNDRGLLARDKSLIAEALTEGKWQFSGSIDNGGNEDYVARCPGVTVAISRTCFDRAKAVGLPTTVEQVRCVWEG